MRIKVLGSAAGGGFPQWNCACVNCRGLRQGTLRGKARSQAQLAVSSDGKAWFLLNASPDLCTQIEATPELQPTAGTRHSPIAGIVLSSGDLDNVLGLLLLREFQPLRIYSTAAIREIVSQDNSFFRLLERVPDQVTWTEFRPGSVFELKSGGRAGASVCCRALALPGSYPAYVKDSEHRRLAGDEAVLALAVESGGAKMLFAPALSAITDELQRAIADCDLLFADGTFWSDDELQQTRGGGPTAREMGHLPVGGKGGSLERLAALNGPRKMYIHINNTNPMLNEESPQHREAREAGWEIAEDGWEFEL
ncbi:MAG TPA: pyrroloquinoline quinone biosynthesis protein PqqB [Terriglobales bacterium]|nr:pyrroloquinoline quinone biosynthesis protein PqqB [Terriglobales bacterium]